MVDGKIMDEGGPSSLERAKRLLEHAKQPVLRNVFKRKLVPQDPENE